MKALRDPQQNTLGRAVLDGGQGLRVEERAARDRHQKADSSG